MVKKTKKIDTTNTPKEFIKVEFMRDRDFIIDGRRRTVKKGNVGWAPKDIVYRKNSEGKEYIHDGFMLVDENNNPQDKDMVPENPIFKVQKLDKKYQNLDWSLRLDPHENVQRDEEILYQLKTLGSNATVEDIQEELEYEISSWDVERLRGRLSEDG